MRKGRKLTGSDFKRARRAAEALYYLRLAKDGDEGRLWQDYRGPIPPVDITASETQLRHTSCFWHAVGIVYYRDPWGKEYRRWGFVKTQTPIKIADQKLDPIVLAAVEAAEDGANAKQRIGQGFIIAPWNKRHPSLVPLIRKHQKDLALTEDDVRGIRDYLESTVEYYTVEEVEEDLDEALRQQLNASH